MPAEPSAKTWRRPRFPRLPAIETTRRERWWFSDGAWIDQGQRGSVVGAVLTHWLADRGVEVSGASLDEQYALELYYASQRQAGGPEGDSYGAQTPAGVQVLKARGLVEKCFKCADMTSVIGALLERGPVVASLPWHQSMFEPARIGGAPVCRLGEDPSIVGGHAVLLDGIALDLELDGVTGFARLKNSWTRDWGQNGLCLISLGDLERLFEPGGFLLLVPPAGALKSGVPRDSAPEDDGPKVFPELDLEAEGAGRTVAATSARAAMSYEPEAIGRDLWTTEDTVGYAVYADSIASGIQHPDTKPPLTIGIKASWGAGKTSLMRMVQRRLEWPETWRDPPHAVRPIRLARPAQGSSERGVTNGALLRSLRTRGPEPAALCAKPEPEPQASAKDDLRWRPTVWFNPWMYQTGEQVWAGFAHELIAQITDRMPRGQRERFWLELNLRRVDEQAVRRKIHALVLERVVPWAVAAAVVLVGAAALALAGVASKASAAVAAGSPVVLLLITARKGARVLGADVGGSLAAVLQPAAYARRFSEEQLAGAFDEVISAPDYRSRSGFFHLVQSDVQRVLDLVATEQRPLVLFVDDLDRCSPGTVVQAIEAINLFLAGEFRNVIFVIAVEPEMVAAHIETAYAGLVAKVEAFRGPGGASDELGWRFLEKFIQLPLTLPLMEPAQTEHFVGGLFVSAGSRDGAGAQEDGVTSSSVASSAGEKAAAAAAAQQMLASAPLGDAVKLAEPSTAGSAFAEAVRATVAHKLSRLSEDPAMHEVIAYGARFLAPNPREIKRFANVLRFFVMIATERLLADLEAPQDLKVLAKLAVLCTRWPSVATDLARLLGTDDERTVFELLEDPPRTEATGEGRKATVERQMLERALARCGLSDASRKRLLADELRTFMRSKPKIGRQARDWL